MIDSLEYYLNRDEHGNLRTQGEPEPLDEPFDELINVDEEDLDENVHNYSYDDENDDDDAIDRKYRGEED